MVIDAVVLGFSTAIFLLLFLGWRFGRASEKGIDDKGNAVIATIPRILEALFYCFAGLMLTVLLFILSESTAALTYYPVVRTVFVIFQIIIGLLSGLGAIGFSILLVVFGVSKALKGVFK